MRACLSVTALTPKGLRGSPPKFTGDMSGSISQPLSIFRKFRKFSHFPIFLVNGGTLLALLLWSSVLQAAVAQQHRAAAAGYEEDLPLYNWGPRAIHIPWNMTPLVLFLCNTSSHLEVSILYNEQCLDGFLLCWQCLLEEDSPPVYRVRCHTILHTLQWNSIWSQRIYLPRSSVKKYMNNTKLFLM